MEEQYKDTTILITARVVDRKLKWKASCKIKFRNGARLVIRHLKLDLDYNTVSKPNALEWSSRKNGLMPECLNL
jgi:hypothetical protein